MPFNYLNDDNKFPVAPQDRRLQDESEGTRQPNIAPVYKTRWPARLVAIIGATLGVLGVIVLQLILVIYLIMYVTPKVFPAFGGPLGDLLLFPPGVFVATALVTPIAAVFDVVILRKSLGFYMKLSLLIALAIPWTMISVRILMMLPVFVA